MKHTTADRKNAWLEIIYHCALITKMCWDVCAGSSVSLNRGASHDHKLTVAVLPTAKYAFPASIYTHH